MRKLVTTARLVGLFLPVSAAGFTQAGVDRGIARLWEKLDRCTRKPLEGADLAADDPCMITLPAWLDTGRRCLKPDAAHP